LDAGEIVFSTGETWGLPVALAGATLRDRRFTHFVYVHRVFSPIWLRFLRVTHRLLAVDGWICVTRYQAGLLRAVLGCDAAPVVVVSQGVDTDFFDPVRAESPWNGPYVLSVGVEMRDYALFFEAVCNLDLPVIVKASSTWMASLRQHFASIPANVKLIAAHLSYAELRDLYAGASLVAVPLHNTPQAAGITTILEAMAMQKCVIATRTRGLPDVLVDGETGVITEPSASGLREAIEDCWARNYHRGQLGTNGQCLVRQEASLAQYADKVLDFVGA
jgi:glycosyltransferase involved in cell wall biosynthesis